jgi:hypothetical protein
MREYEIRFTVQEEKSSDSEIYNELSIMNRGTPD